MPRGRETIEEEEGNEEQQGEHPHLPVAHKEALGLIQASGKWCLLLIIRADGCILSACGATSAGREIERDSEKEERKRKERECVRRRGERERKRSTLSWEKWFIHPTWEARKSFPKNTSKDEMAESLSHFLLFWLVFQLHLCN
jgi:hypothetical protein